MHCESLHGEIIPASRHKMVPEEICRFIANLNIHGLPGLICPLKQLMAFSSPPSSLGHHDIYVMLWQIDQSVIYADILKKILAFEVNVTCLFILVCS